MLCSEFGGITSVTRQSPGTYCINVTGLFENDKPLVATVETTTVGSKGDTSVLTTDEYGCLGGEYVVKTMRHPYFKVTTTGGTERWAIGMAEAANDVSFSFVVL